MSFVVRVIACLCLALCGWVAVSQAAVPNLVNFQGLLTDASNVPIVGDTMVTFSVYAVPSGPDVPLWSETMPVTTDAQGRFNVLLGAFTPLDADVFSGPARYLGVTIGAGPELTPRVRITSVAYAHRVGTVDDASGGDITSKVTIGPGHTNTGAEGFVAGTINTLTGDTALIDGGAYNTASGVYAVIGGGKNNKARGPYSVVAGGGNSNTDSNAALGWYSTVSGGHGNTADDYNAVVGGGEGNRAGGFGSTVGGGGSNSATGFMATIGGGSSNVASGTLSTIPGGNGNRAYSDESFAAGRKAVAAHSNTFVWNSDFDSIASTGTEQFIINAAGGVGINTNAPYEDLTVNGTIGFKNGTAPLAYMFQSGTGNPSRPILAHSPSFPDWGLRYDDVADDFVFQSDGNAVLKVALNSRYVGVRTASAPTTPFQVNGCIATAVTTTTGNLSLNESHSVVLVNTTDLRTITLPDPATCVGRVYTIKRISPGSAFDIYVLSSGGATVDGQASIGLDNQYEAITVVSSGSEWLIVSRIP